MTEQGKRLLTLKGVTAEEEEPEAKVDSAQILQRYLRKKKDAATDVMSSWDTFDAQWNPDGTLSRITLYKNGEAVDVKDFAWNPNGSLSKIVRLHDNGR